ncbi:MAG TPA: hypothetical protein PKJ98_02840 [Verrucomicrobiota bacterium]|nr:hypothetical protein [Verrucomicrobiota bacterium]
MREPFRVIPTDGSPALRLEPPLGSCGASWTIWASRGKDSKAAGILA